MQKGKYSLSQQELSNHLIKKMIELKEVTQRIVSQQLIPSFLFVFSDLTILCFVNVQSYLLPPKPTTHLHTKYNDHHHFISLQCPTILYNPIYQLMKFLPLFLLLLPSLLLAATTTKRYTPPNFTTLKVLGPFQTILTQNQNTSAVIVTADSQKLVNLVVVEWRNRSLLVRVKENTVVDLKSFKSLKVYVSASRQLLRIETGDGNYLQGKNLRFGRGMEIVVSGSSTMQFNSLNSPTLSITCSGSSTLSTSHLTTTKNLTIQASGSSHIRSNSGSIQNLSAYLTGSSTLDLGSTIVNNANLEAVATSSIDVFVGRRARARATLVSTITVRGNAIVEKFVDMLSSVNVEGKGVGKGSNGK